MEEVGSSVMRTSKFAPPPQPPPPPPQQQQVRGLEL